MSKPIPTIWPIEPHTKAKHEILKYYLQQWLPILGRTSNKILYLDGFAGPGMYKGGEDGSPVIALQTAIEHSQLPYFKADLMFNFIERDKARFEILKKVLEYKFPKLPSNFSYEVLDAEFAPTLKSVLDNIEEKGAKLDPTLAFLDPFGFSGLPMELIGRMLSYKRCEVLITFMSGFVNRFSDELRESTLNELFATEAWQDVNKIKKPKKRKQFLINLYSNQLKSVGGAKYVKSFEMIGTNNQTIYYLVYGTKHWKGLEAIKEAMLRVDRRGTYKFSDLTHPKQKFLIDYSSQGYWISKAAELVFQRFQGRTVPIEAIHSFVIIDTPYIFRKSILISLEICKPPKIKNVIGRSKRKTYPKGCIITFNKKQIKS